MLLLPIALTNFVGGGYALQSISVDVYEALVLVERLVWDAPSDRHAYGWVR